MLYTRILIFLDFSARCFCINVFDVKQSPYQNYKILLALNKVFQYFCFVLVGFSAKKMHIG